MRMCPKCKTVSLDVTGKRNPEYGCWECKKTYATYELLLKDYYTQRVAPELRLHMEGMGRKMEAYYTCAICEMSGSNNIVHIRQKDDIRKRYITHLKIAHDLDVDESTIATNMGDLEEFSLKKLNKGINRKVKN